MADTLPTVSWRRGRELFAGVAAVNVALAIGAAAAGGLLLPVLAGFSALAALEAAVRRPASAGPRALWLVILASYLGALALLLGPRLLRTAG